MTPDLEAIKARLAAATPGPWIYDEWYGTEDGGWAAIGPHHEAGEGECDEPDGEPHERAKRDGALIAHAPTDLAALVAEVERLREDYEAACRDAAVRQSIADTRREAIERLEAVAECNAERLTAARAERDEARAEVERLRGLVAFYAPSFCPMHDTDAPTSNCDCAATEIAHAVRADGPGEGE
jgi:hypothetical protein